MLDLLLCALTATALALLLLASRDFRLIRLGLHSLARSRRCRARLRFCFPEAEALWRQVSTVLLARQSTAEVRPPLSEWLTAGEEIVKNAGRESRSAEAACALLIKNLAPQICAAAVILPGRDGKLRVAAAAGIAARRIEASVAGHVESMRDGESIAGAARKHPEHILPRPHSPLDFSALGLGASYFAPIRENGSVSGAIWLGFRGSSTTLAPDRLSFINALAQHCAASFSAARDVESRIAEHERERRWLLGMSHDLRAPGNSALYSLRDLLSEDTGPLNAEQRLRLAIIEACVCEQIDLVDDILDLVKDRSGELVARPERLAIGALIRRTLDPFQADAAQRSLELNVRCSNDLVGFADAKQLRRALTNLISNALKYTDEGSVSISADGDHDLIRLSVSDTGIGVPEAERAALFQDFRRMGNVAARSGTGLGLSIAKTLAELNGGSLSYQSRSEGGSTFILTLPSAPPIDRAPRRLNRLLIVEDEPATSRAHARSFQNVADRVTIAPSTDEALAAIRACPPDAVVTDFFLRGETTEDLIHMLRAKLPNVPICITTGALRHPLLTAFLTDPGIRLLEKPVDRAALLSAVLENRSEKPSGSLASSPIIEEESAHRLR